MFRYYNILSYWLDYLICLCVCTKIKLENLTGKLFGILEQTLLTMLNLLNNAVACYRDLTVYQLCRIILNEPFAVVLAGNRIMSAKLNSPVLILSRPQKRLLLLLKKMLLLR